MTAILLRGGRVIDPAANYDAVSDLLVDGGQVAAIGPDLAAPPDARVLDVTGKLVVPGLIDLHCHVYWGGTMIGVLPDPLCQPSGVTTVVDLGTAGADNFNGLRHFIMEPATTRVISFLHVASIGLVNQGIGELRDNAYVNIDKVVRTVEANREWIGGLKVRFGSWISGDNCAAGLKLACQARDAVGLPLAMHIGSQAVYLTEMLKVLKPGDILTHIFRDHTTPETLYDEGGHIRPEVFEAQRQGIHFDVGHGAGSFTFGAAQRALDDGFLPDTISTDAYTHNVHGPVFDLPTTMSKFLAMGMPIEQIIPRVTSNAARALAHMEQYSRIAGIGTFQPIRPLHSTSNGVITVAGVANGQPLIVGGSGAGNAGNTGDVSVLDIREGEFTFHDSRKNALSANRRIVNVATIRAGQLVWQEGQA